MKSLFVVGIIAMLAGVYTLLIMYNTDSTPARWPYNATHRDDDPVAFQRHLTFWWSVGATGLLLVIASYLAEKISS